jgi:PAS domain S-box-containing protein
MMPPAPTALQVLIVDDVAEDRREMRRLLLLGSDRRYVFTEASSGSECLERFGAAPDGHAPDCLLLDYGLPDVTALELLASLRLADGTTRCPVLVVTLSTEHDLGRAALRAGAQDFVEKGSLSPSSLTHAVDHAIERWTMTRELRERDATLYRSARRDFYFRQLAEATRGLVDPQAVKYEACRVLGKHLEASRVVYADVTPNGTVLVERGYIDGVTQIDGRYRFADFGAHLQSEFDAGRSVIVADVGQDPNYTAAQKAACAAIGLTANLSVPLLHDNALVAVLGVHQKHPRVWSADDVSLVRETAERTLTVVGHARVQEHLRASEARLRVALQAGGMGVWHWNPQTDDGDVDEAIDAFSGLGPTTPADDAVRRFLDCVDADDLATMRAHADAALRDGAPYRREFRFRHPDGSVRWFASHGTALPAKGTSTNLVGVTFEITERRQAESALRDNEARLAQLIQLMPSFTAVLKGPMHVFELANDPYYALVGRGSEILGRPLLEALPEIAEQPFPALLDRVLATGEIFQAKGMLVRLERGAAGLEQRFIDFAYMPLRDAAGAPNGILIHGVDRTEQVAAERGLIEADQRKDEFIATLAHELRSPLAPIRNGLELLQRRGISQPIEPTVAMMQRQLGHLVHLVDDLLDVSRVSLGKISMTFERVAIGAVLDGALESARPAIEAGRHAVVMDDGGDGLEVDGDATRLVQIVANLIVNAAKYSEAAGRIRISASRQGESVVIRVGDRGLGIAADVLPTLWNMFSQVRDTIDKAQGGLGIGLALVKKLVELHGGTVGAESAGVGHGSTFIVRLPLAHASAALAAVATPTRAAGVPAAAAVASRPTARKVLVVDDNEDGARSLAVLLGQDHEVLTAGDGIEALDRAAAFQPDVVLLDIGLPGIDGYEVARRLRADPRHMRTLIVALTGWGSEDDKRRAENAGFDAHLTKPVDVAAVEALLSAHRGAIVSGVER